MILLISLFFPCVAAAASGGYNGPVMSTTGCPPLASVAFVRTARAAAKGTPITSAQGDELACAQQCKAMTNCAGFNYDSGSCQLLADSGDFEPNPSSTAFFFHRVCLSGYAHTPCDYRSYVSERLRNTQLEGFVKKSLPAYSLEDCVVACLQEQGFTCLSANYDHSAKFCELSDQDRRSKPQFMRTAYGKPVDYFDNNCLNRQNRCGRGMAGGNLVFVKMPGFEISGFDLTSSTEPSESHCLQKCLDASNVMCRSIEYDASTKQCVLSDEDTYSRADRQKGSGAKGGYASGSGKTYYEPLCISSDLSSSTCRQKAAFTKHIGHAVAGEPVATSNQATAADCLSLCFQSLDCKAVNYDRTRQQCYVLREDKHTQTLSTNPAVDYYQFHCESQFGGIALCTDQGIKFIVNTKDPYTGAIYAAERFATCSKVVTNAQQITLLFPPPTVNGNCGTVLRDGRLEADVVVSLDGVLPHQVTTEWDRFYRVSCDTTLVGLGEGSVVVTTIFDTADAQPQLIPVGTPGPVTASLMFVDKANKMIPMATIGDEVFLVAKSPESGPRNMMLVECTAARVGGDGDSVPFKIIDNGCPTYPALLGPVVRDFANNRLAAPMKAFRLDGSFDIRITCTVMFFAGPNGCPPSNCLDAGTYQIFQSYGRKRRSPANNTVDDIWNASEEELTAYLRVLADGEESDDHFDWPTRSLNLVEVQSSFADEMMCIDERSFVAIVVTVALLCLLFTGVIVAWACARLGKHGDDAQGADASFMGSEAFSSLTAKLSRLTHSVLGLAPPSSPTEKAVSVLPQ